MVTSGVERGSVNVLTIYWPRLYAPSAVKIGEGQTATFRSATTGGTEATHE